MEEKSFRVLLDLTEVNEVLTDLKYVWMFVSPRELKTIYDFKQAIIKKLTFPTDNFKLFVRDGLLLENEKITILREDDTVKLQCESFYQSINVTNNRTNDLETTKITENHLQINTHNLTSLQEPRKRKSEAFTSSENECNFLQKDHKKKKRDKYKSNTEECLDDVEATEVVFEVDSFSLSDHSQRKNSKKKIDKQNVNSNDLVEQTLPAKEIKRISFPKKNIKSVLSTSHDITVDLENTESCEKRKNSFQTNTENTVNLVDSSNDSLNKSSEVDSELILNTQGNNCKTKKRKRKRKRKQLSETITLVPENVTTFETNFNNDVDGCSSKTNNSSSDIRKHVIFHSPTPPRKNIDENSIELNTCEVIYECQDLHLSNTELENNSTNTSDVDSSKNKIVLLDQSADLSSNMKQTNSSLKISTPFSKKILKSQSWGVTPLPKISNAVSNSFSIENIKYSNKQMSLNSEYSDCPLLKSVPSIGTRLVYKTLELDENYCPEVSQYKEGIVKSINPSTDELEIELIQEEVKPGRVGKFENLKADEIPPTQVIKTVSINWASLIQPRLLSY